MKSTAFIGSLCVLAYLAMAQDTPEIFSLITTHSGNPEIHLQPVVANGQSFWAGADVPQTSTYCPDIDQVQCPPPTNVTYLSQSQGSTTAAMYVEVPGGQQVYVDGNTGALAYTIAHSGYAAGAVLEPFTYSPYASGLAGFSIPGGAIACPDKNSYKLYGSDYKTDDKSACIGVGLIATPASHPALAWEYT